VKLLSPLVQTTRLLQLEQRAQAAEEDLAFLLSLEGKRGGGSCAGSTNSNGLSFDQLPPRWRKLRWKRRH
jgi:hypothetical protein